MGIRASRGVLAFVSAGLFGSTVVAAPYNTNLLANPGAETNNLSGWSTSGSWATDWSGVTGHDSPHAFLTSYTWSTRTQTVDLIAAGFSAAQLDAAPQIECSEWAFGRSFGSYYYQTFSLLDANHNVIRTIDNGTQASPIYLASGDETPWFQTTPAIFTGYGSGLRYVRFSDGGKSEPAWAGYYGTYFDDASVTLVPEPIRGVGLPVLSACLLWRRRSKPESGVMRS